MERKRRAIVAGVAALRLEGALSAAGFDAAGRAHSADGALALIESAPADLLLADAVLPGLDGVALAESALQRPLWVRPAVILTAPRGLSVPGAERLAGLNACLLTGTPGPADIAAAFREIADRPPALPPASAARLDAALDSLGVPVHPGRRALAAAAALAWQDRRRLSDMKHRLYPRAGQLCGLTAAQAERAMRYAIDAAWRTAAIEAQDRLFGDTIDARRGRPTCGEMIARLADILRWEG